MTDSSTSSSAAGATTTTTYLDVPYSTASPLCSMDIYLPASPSSSSVSSVSPALIHPSHYVYVHGGLWCARDKAEYANVARALLAPPLSALSVSIVNYRLTTGAVFKDNPHPHPTHTLDMIHALSTLFGGDSESTQRTQSNELPACLPFVSGSVVLLGHSCGAHMLSLSVLSSPPLIHDTLLRRVRAIIGIEGMYALTVYAADFPDWQGEIARTMGDDVSLWPDVVDVHRDSSSTSTATAPPPDIAWLIIHSIKDTYVNTTQAQLMHSYLRQLYSPAAVAPSASASPSAESAVSSSVELVQLSTGGHFEVIEQMGGDADQITPLIAWMLEQCSAGNASAK